MNTHLLSLILTILLTSTICFADVQMDGVDDYVEVVVTSVSALRPSPEMTACIWSKRNGASETYAALIGVSYTDGDSSPYNAWSIFTDNTSDTNFFGSVAGTNGLSPNNTSPTYNAFPNTTDWHYVCMRTRFTTVIIGEFLVDGVVRSSVTTGATGIAYDTTAGAGELHIGCDSDDTDGCTNHTNTEFTYWNTALTDAEILSIYNSKKRRFSLQVQSDNVILHLPLDEYPDGKAVSGSTFFANNQVNNGTAAGGASIISTAGSILTYPE